MSPAAPNTTHQGPPSLRTPDELVDFISAAAHGLVRKVNIGQAHSETQYQDAVARTFDALTARLLAHPDRAFADRVRHTLQRAQHRLPAQTRARLRSTQP